MNDLAAYGWDNRWQAAFAEAATPEAEPARIVRVDRGECTVVGASGRIRVLSDSTRAQGRVAPVVGDWIAVETDLEAGPFIAAVLARRHVLARRDPGERVVEQPLAANIDHVLIVHGLDRPLPPGRLERMLVMAWDSGAHAMLILSKADLDDVHGARAVAHALTSDADIVEVSRVDGRGVLDLRRRIPTGETAALVGESGAGKSNLVNLLVGEAVQATGKVRARDAKGRHTTVAREIYRIPNCGLVVDTPGIRAIGLWAADETLHRVFADIDALSESCRFRNCGHHREPGCAVHRAIGAGELDERRLARFHALADELIALAERDRGKKDRRPTRR